MNKLSFTFLRKQWESFLSSLFEAPLYPIYKLSLKVWQTQLSPFFPQDQKSVWEKLKIWEVQRIPQTFLTLMGQKNEENT